MLNQTIHHMRSRQAGSPRDLIIRLILSSRVVGLMTLTSVSQVLGDDSLGFCMCYALFPTCKSRLKADSAAVTTAMFSCTGGEMVAMAAGEAKDPWQDIPIVMSFVYLVPLSLYPITMLSAGANINYANPNLPLMWAKVKGRESLSPFVIAVQETSLHGLPKALNLFFIISAYTAA
jgi:amino acid permease